MKKHFAPIIAAIVLLLPLLYVGSYLAIVDPSGRYPVFVSEGPWLIPDENRAYPHQFRSFSAALYYPLEQIDRWVRPSAWRLPLGSR